MNKFIVSFGELEKVETWYSDREKYDKNLDVTHDDLIEIVYKLKNKINLLEEQVLFLKETKKD